MKEKRIKFDDSYINVKFFKRSKKNFIIRIVGEDIHLSLPKSGTYKRAEQFLTKKQEIVKKMWEKSQKNSKNQEKSSIFYLGQNYKLVEKKDIEKIYMENGIIYAKNREALKSWMKVEAERLIKERYMRISTLIGIKGEKIRIKPLKSAWGICYSNGNLTFNSILLCLPEYIIDYVIIHELCHRIHMNHSKEFWFLVESYFEKHKEARKVLRVFGKSIHSNNIFI